MMGSRAGQALVETAFVLPVLLILFLAFLLVMVVAQAWIEVDTATSLAASAAANAPANSAALSHQYALATYSGTLKRTGYLEPTQLEGCGGYASGTGEAVTCTGHAMLDMSKTPLALLQPWNSHWTIAIQVTASADSSRYRST